LSSFATESRRATGRFERLLGRHAIPIRRQASAKMARMSSDRFEKWYRG